MKKLKFKFTKKFSIVVFVDIILAFAVHWGFILVLLLSFIIEVIGQNLPKDHFLKKPILDYFFKNKD